MGLTNKTPERVVNRLFDDIADHYDEMNDVMTFKTQRNWRRQAMRLLHIETGARVLDVCCGTADWTIALARAVGPTGHVTGLDFSRNMLAIGDKKVTQAKQQKQVSLVEGDAMHLPFADNTFEAATIGFGLRNVPDANQVLREMVRVVKPGGLVASLETSIPENVIIKIGWRAYFKLVPYIAKLRVHNFDQYNYLQTTAKQFVSATKLQQMFETAGVSNVAIKRFMFGAAALHYGRTIKK
ncbi:demethylmenaquinone methyltransferase [Lentilactobacillus sp. Marseille-Q4993]|uniref:demethylmenaquinone methyltransferase n=1 Tax=Lentilactobacillus sp. Marseille-Q4993 TaxID=3039492 RepID=UPI0024BC032F|nr:demethylmenaquinone methyltransferase [Lentilactobacillus sp. Marseille-Q4993]